MDEDEQFAHTWPSGHKLPVSPPFSSPDIRPSPSPFSPSLGPPLDILPALLDESELQRFREDYQAFRMGHSLGARGEIMHITTERLHTGSQVEDLSGQTSPIPDSRQSGRQSPTSNGLRDEEPEAPIQEYFSEPEPIQEYFSEPEFVEKRWPSFSAEAVEFRGHVSDPLRKHEPVEDPPSSPASSMQGKLSVRNMSCPDLFELGADNSAFFGLEDASSSPEVPSSLRREHLPQPADRQNFKRFSAWFYDELRSGPNEAQLGKIPKSHLREVVAVPKRVEKVLGFGMLLSLDIVLHELSFTPVQVLRAASQSRARSLTVTERCDCLRLLLLMLNVLLLACLLNESQVYHYFRGESHLKLYVMFNMLEMFERWLRSVGVDLMDLVMSSVLGPTLTLLRNFVVALIYCSLHTAMHYVRVTLINVALNTSSSAVFLLLVTNNFGEIKSTVFKKYQADSLFPIITSDIVERFYLVIDIFFVVTRLSISPQKTPEHVAALARLVLFLILMEVITDWLKFCLIVKFSDMKANTLEVYKEVLMADILLCRAKFPWRHAFGDREGSPRQNVEQRVKDQVFKGIHSFSHVPARRIGFSGIPMTTLVVMQVWILLRSPCTWDYSRAGATLLLLFIGLPLCFLLKVWLGAFLLGYSARRRKNIAKGLDLFSKIKAL